MAELLYSKLTYKIRGACFNVYNELGFGHKEKVYQKALATEFEIQNIPFEREKRLKVIYRSQKVGVYVPDFIIDNKIILEIKAVEFLPQKLEKQLIYYLKGTNFGLGLLVNFGASPLEIRRKIWTRCYKAYIRPIRQ